MWRSNTAAQTVKASCSDLLPFLAPKFGLYMAFAEAGVRAEGEAKCLYVWRLLIGSEIVVCCELFVGVHQFN
jgi:hypothetical protein